MIPIPYRRILVRIIVLHFEGVGLGGNHTHFRAFVIPVLDFMHGLRPVLVARVSAGVIRVWTLFYGGFVGMVFIDVGRMRRAWMLDYG